MIDSKMVSLKEFVRLAKKYKTRYIRVNPQKNTLLMKIERVIGKHEFDLWYKTEIDITTYLHNETQQKKLTTVHLHYNDADVFLTLLKLATRTKKIYIEYWLKNNCELLEKHDLNQESIFFKTQDYQVRIDQVYEGLGIYQRNGKLEY